MQDEREIIENALEVEEKYTVAGGWQLGWGPASYTCAIYCRPKDGANQDWSWRYVVNLGERAILFFDDLVGVLDWYKSCMELDEKHLHITAEEVFES